MEAEVDIPFGIKIKDEPLDGEGHGENQGQQISPGVDKDVLPSGDMEELYQNEDNDQPLDLTKVKVCEIKTEREEGAEDVKPSIQPPTIKTEIKQEEEHEEQTVPVNLTVEKSPSQNILQKQEEEENLNQIEKGPTEKDPQQNSLKVNVKEEQLPKKPRPVVKELEGRIEIVRKVTRKFYCKICMDQVPSLEQLVIHLDREHKIRVKGPPRVVSGYDRDDKEDLKHASDVLKSVDNKPRTTEPVSDYENSDDDYAGSDFDFVSSDDNDELDTDDEDDEETAYVKLRERVHRRLVKQEGAWGRKMATQLLDPVFFKEMSNFRQCCVCFVESPLGPRFRLHKAMHKRQHTDGEYKHCPHCGMGFLHEYQLDKHLEDLSVPVVPPWVSRTEAEDLLYVAHPCFGGLPGTTNYGSWCGAAFANRKCLLFHKTRCHDHYHRCPSCEKPYIHYSALRKHIHRIHNWEGRMLECPVPNCDKLFQNKKAISTHIIHGHSKEEKELYGGGNKYNVMEETPGSNIVRHKPPQTFWRMITDRLNKTMNYVEKTRTESVKRNKIWGKTLQSTPASSPVTPAPFKLPHPTHKIKTEINNSPNELPNNATYLMSSPGQMANVTNKRPSTASTSSPGRRFRNYNGVNSLPPKEYAGGLVDKKRNMFQHRLFTHVCGLCSRSFRTNEARDLHVAETHKIDLSLENPYKCPAEGCQETRQECRYLLTHIRNSHPPSVQESLIIRSLEEDKITAPAGEEPYRRHYKSIAVDGGDDIKIEDGDDDDNNDEFSDHYPLKGPSEPTNNSVSRKLVNKEKQVASSSSSRRRGRRPKGLARPLISERNKRQLGPTADLARAVLSNFKIGDRFYCPECPLTSRKPMHSPWSVHRHMTSFHPTSPIIKNPASVKLEVLKPGEGGEANAMAFTVENNNTTEDYDEEYENRPEQNDDNENGEEINEDPDFITRSSSPSTLSAFRRFLHQYRASSGTKDDFSLFCPICLEMDSSSTPRTYSNIHNLQQHIFNLHSRTNSTLLRKSNLKEFIVNALPPPQGAPKRVGVGVKQRKRLMKISGFRGAGRINKMKATAMTVSRHAGRRGGHRKKGEFLSPLTATLSQYKTECGTKVYCPVCHSVDEVRTFINSHNLIRHMKSDHPDCELLKLSATRVLKTEINARRTGRKRAQGKLSETDSESDQSMEGHQDELDDFEVDTVQQETYKDENGFVEVAPPKQSDDESDLDEDSDLDEIKVESEVGAVLDTPLVEVKIKLEQATTVPESGKIKYEPPAEPDFKGRWSCPLCPEEDRPSYTQVWNLNRHVRRKHGEYQVENESSSSSLDVGKPPHPSIGSSGVAPASAISSDTKLRLYSESDSNSDSCLNSNNLSKSGVEMDQKVLSELADIRAKTNPDKIRCPFCPAQKHNFICYIHLYRHLQRSCPVWKSMHPENPIIDLSESGEVIERLWSCNWCIRRFGYRHHLTRHFQRDHREITGKESDAYLKVLSSKVTELYTCDRCNRLCKSSTGFKQHRLSCVDSTSNPIKNEPPDGPDGDESYNPVSCVTPKKVKNTKVEDSEGVENETVSKLTAPRRKSNPRPKRGSTKYSRPRYKDNSSSDEDYDNTDLQLEMDRFSNDTSPETESQPDEEEEWADEGKKEFTCSICSKTFTTKKSLGAHHTWHKRRNDVVEPSQNKRARLDEDEDDLEGVIIPEGQQVDPSMDEDEEVDVTDMEDAALDQAAGMDADDSDLIMKDILEDTAESVVEDKCPYCDEWFSSAMEKSDHFIRVHSNRGLSNSNGQEFQE